MSQPYRPSLTAKMARSVARSLKFAIENNYSMDQEDRENSLRFLRRIDTELFIRTASSDETHSVAGELSPESEALLAAHLEKIKDHPSLTREDLIEPTEELTQASSAVQALKASIESSGELEVEPEDADDAIEQQT